MPWLNTAGSGWSALWVGLLPRLAALASPSGRGRAKRGLQVSANLETLAFNVKMPDGGTTIDSLMMGQADSGYVFEIRLEAALLPRLIVQLLIVHAKCVGEQLVAGAAVPLLRQLRPHLAGRPQ